MKNKVYKNYLYSVGYQTLVTILPIITTPYISRVIGAEGLGRYGYTQSVTYYFILAGCFGFSLYGQREIAYVQTDKAARSEIFWEIEFLRLFTHLISLISFLFVIFFNKKYKVLYIIQTLDILASMLDVSWFFQGLEDFKKIVTRNIIVKLIGVILIFLLVKNVKDIYLYVFIFSCTTFLGNIFLWTCIPKYIDKFDYKKCCFIKHLKPSIMLFFPQLATSIYNVLDKTMIGSITNIEAEVAYYEQAQKIVKLALSFLTAMGTVMMPRASSIYAKGDYELLNSYIKKSFEFVFAIGIPVMLGIMAISSGLVPWFFGNGYEKVIPNIILIAPIILIVGWSNVIGVQFLLPTGCQKEYLISVLCGSIVNIILNICFIPRFYSLGAAVASVCAEVIVLIFQFVMIDNKFIFKGLFKESLIYWVSGGIMFIIVLLFVKFMKVSLINTLWEILLGIATYVIMLLVLREKNIHYLLKKLKQKIGRNE